MNKAQLCDLLGYKPPAGPDFTFDAVTEDSRKVRPGTLFVAVHGDHTDGHAYAEQAVSQGAPAVVGDRAAVDNVAGAPYLYASSPRRVLGLLAHALAGHPSRTMVVIGVTGTNGKSSTAFLIQAILAHAGHPCANFGTLGYDVGGEILPASLTTPFPEQLAHAFCEAQKRRISHVVMEASSHALDQDRVAGIAFDVAAFTNLTQDHLDYHADMEAYRRAKLKLFEGVSGEGRFTVINSDDPAATFFVAVSRTPFYQYGRSGDVYAESIQAGRDGTTFRLKTPWGDAPVNMPLLGRHNVWNALCAAAVCGGLGIPVAQVAQGLAALVCVPGRFEPVFAGQDFQVVVDYAHTGDALDNVLQAGRALCNGRLIVVFGCGGDRDKGKRPKMGKVAAKRADYTVLTSDNPRTEDPARILLDIETGMQGAGAKKGQHYEVIPERAGAIARAIALANSGDLVLIAGKGHEDYQIVGTERRHFDDRETARELLMKRN
ncbi:MAG: UDP-N-acetylmuramoyl-L-alanyl-D-glutamate--2,6-diaminopimelate ligase [Candidatus Hydrogenedentota bacterium]